MSAASTASAAPARSTIDGRAVRSCLRFAVQVDGAEIGTVEGLAEGRGAEPVAGGVPPPSRVAMRLLHGRHPDLGDAVPGDQPRPDRGRGARHAVGPYLPLHGLRGDGARDPRRRGRRAVTAIPARHRLRPRGRAGPPRARRGRRRGPDDLCRVGRRDRPGRGRARRSGDRDRGRGRRRALQPGRDGDAVLGVPADRRGLRPVQLARQWRRFRLRDRECRGEGVRPRAAFGRLGSSSAADDGFSRRTLRPRRRRPGARG